MQIRTLAAPAVLALVVGAAALSGDASSSTAPHKRAERATAQRTERFLEAFERRDLPALASMLDAEATLVHPISFSGSQQPDPDARFTGREQVLGYFRAAFDLMGRIRFAEPRVSVVAGGRESFVQADGDFTTADGRPYDNVYLFHVTWRGDSIVSAEEYYNPVTFSKTFGRPLG